MNKNKVIVYIFVTPFVMSTAVEFLPYWISIPIGVIGLLTMGLLSGLLLIQEIKK